MKKAIIILALLAIMVPASAQAFSFPGIKGIWNKIFTDDNDYSEEDVDYASLIKPLADYKYEIWEESYENKRLYGLMKDSRNLYFTNAEANYILGKKLQELKNPPADDFEIWFKDGYAYARAHMIKYFRGDISGEIEFVKEKKRTVPKVRKARWGKIWIPTFIVNAILRTELKALIDFLYSDPNFPYIDITVEEDLLELKFRAGD